jgi:hypothetical protein
MNNLLFDIGRRVIVIITSSGVGWGGVLYGLERLKVGELGRGRRGRVKGD